VREGITCWNAAVVEGAERDEAVSRLGAYQRFLDALRPINTAGKLKNFAATSEQVQAQAEAQITLAEIQALESLVRELQPLTAYLLQARAVLPADDPVAAAGVTVPGARGAVVVTGASTGIGHATALLLDREGFTVFAERRILEAIDGAWLVHIAAHGTFRSDSPLFSSLRMDDGPPGSGLRRHRNCRGFDAL